MSESSREQLEHLLASPGWAVFQRYVEQEWGDGGLRFRQEMNKALDLTDNNAAASQARQILSGQKVIQTLMRWPSEELARLQKQAKPTEAEPTMSRRGSL